VTLVIQVNGKIRSRISVPADMDEEQIRQRALEDEKIESLAEGKTIQRVIVVPHRLVNVVVR
jgi:leucyl-tRNA synthetase